PLVAVVGDDGELPVRRDVDVVRPEAHREVVGLVVGHVRAVALQHRHLVRGELDGERTLAVWGDGDRGALVLDGHRADEAHVLPGDRQDRDRLVVAVRDQRQIAAGIDRDARRLLADLERGDRRRRADRQVEDVQLVVGDELPRAALLDGVHRVGDQRELLVGGDRHVRGRADDRGRQRAVGDGRRRIRVCGDVEDRDRVLSRRGDDGLARVVEAHLLVVADDEEGRLAGGGGGRGQG